jgi:hypothetical protein
MKYGLSEITHSFKRSLPFTTLVAIAVLRRLAQRAHLRFLPFDMVRIPVVAVVDL